MNFNLACIYLVDNLLEEWAYVVERMIRMTGSNEVRISIQWKWMVDMKYFIKIPHAPLFVPLLSWLTFTFSLSLSQPSFQSFQLLNLFGRLGLCLSCLFNLYSFVCAFILNFYESLKRTIFDLIIWGIMSHNINPHQSNKISKPIWYIIREIKLFPK